MKRLFKVGMLSLLSFLTIVMTGCTLFGNEKLNIATSEEQKYDAGFDREVVAQNVANPELGGGYFFRR